MKVFIKKTVIFALIFALLAVTVCVCIDPYNVFHPLSYRENGVEPNKNFLKMTYILHNGSKFDTFIFGSSRVGYIDTGKIENARAYNMTYSMGVPAEHADNIRTMIRNGIIPKMIIMEVDDISYRMDAKSHIDEQPRCPYEYLVRHPLKFAELYCCPAVALESLEIIQYSSRNEDEERNMYASGSTIRRNDNSEYVFPETVDMSGSSYMDNCIDAISECVELCRDNGIDLKVFVTPLYKATYRGALERGDFFTFLTRLSEVTPFYNFSGFNDITVNSENYEDVSHYKAEIGDMIIDCIVNGKTDEKLLSQGFGFYTDRANISQLLKILTDVEFTS